MILLKKSVRNWVFSRKDESNILSAVYNFARRIKVNRTRRHNVAMFHIGRCGSTVLGNMLNSHPDVYWAGELFSNFKNKYAGIQHDLHSGARILTHSKMSNNQPVYGFELNYLPQQQLGEDGINCSLEAFFALLLSGGFTHFIVLHRRNYLRRNISIQVASQTGLWHTTKDVKKPTQICVPKPQRLPGWFAAIDREHSRIINLTETGTHLHLMFEDCIRNDPRVAYLMTCEFLGIRPVEIEVKLKPTNSFKMQQLISNFDEVSNELEGTDFAWMLND